MADNCHIKGCPDTPKYRCSCDDNIKICENHKSFHPGPAHQTVIIDLARENVQSKVQKEIAGLFGMSSQVLSTGKEMFIEICEKLCNITDDIFKRQQDLLTLSSSQSYPANVEEDIKALSEVNIRIKKREDFKKMIDRHFSLYDDITDFKVFSKDFEALKQKGIENYELALNALDRAQNESEGKPEQLAAVYFERGKNLAALKRYDEAEATYNQVLEIKGEQLNVMEALYDVHYQQKDYDKAVPLVKKLIRYDGLGIELGFPRGRLAEILIYEPR